MSDQVRTGLDEPALAAAEPADLLEQGRAIVPDDDADAPAEIAWEADAADALEQAREVGLDDERDHDA